MRPEVRPEDRRHRLEAVRPEDHGFGETALDLPSFIADTLRAIAGERGRVINAADLMMDPDGGLRTVNDADQLAAFEFAATFTSQGLRNVLAKIEPGMTELAGRAADRHERPAAIGAPDADRRQARRLRPALARAST